MRFSQYQHVRSKREIHGVFAGKKVIIKPGTQGEITEIHQRADLPTGYDVEFFDEAGNTISQTIVYESDIEPWEGCSN